MNSSLKILIDRRFWVNTYVLTQGAESIVIDPSFSDTKINEYLAQTKTKLVGIVLTHGHYDHIGNTFALAKQHNIKVYVHQAEQSVIDKYHLAKDLGSEPNIDLNLIIYFNDRELKIGSFDFNVLLTPGHTCGSICLKYHHDIFTGDTLFYDSVGRTDLATGNSEQLTNSLKLILSTYTDDCHIYPGHGTNGLLKNIKQSNRWLQ